MAGHKGCLGSKFDTAPCREQKCEKIDGEKEGKLVPSFATPFSLRPFEQSCVDYHNFFRALHNQAPLLWDPSLQESAQKWADYLTKAAPTHPLELAPGFEATAHWPHSDQDGEYRGKGIGENIAWDFSAQGSPCDESVYRWYAEYFYFNEKNPMVSRRKNQPVGHLTQMMWTTTEAVGCAKTDIFVPNKAGYSGDGMISTYTVCHYTPQGNIIGLELENWKTKDKKLCSTFDGITGKSDCGESGACMGLNSDSECGCSYLMGTKLPRCTGHCIVQCWNVWGTRNFWPQECMGTSSCTCDRNGAVCI